MPLEGHDHDLTALAEKAKVIADATGRCEEDVLADLSAHFFSNVDGEMRRKVCRLIEANYPSPRREILDFD